jgi:putative DNA primase/helicase
MGFNATGHGEQMPKLRAIPSAEQEPAPPIVSTKPIEGTQAHEAEKFIHANLDNLRYIEDRKVWVEWNGYYWGRESVGCIRDRIRKQNYKALEASMQTAAFAGAVERICRDDDRCRIAAGKFDTDPWLLGTPGGVIDLRTGQYVLGKPLVTKVTRVAPAAKADCPRFWKFMDEITLGDKEFAQFLLRYGGYCLTGDMRERLFLYLFGEGRNGKTTYVNSVLHWLLNDYARTATINSFLSVATGQHTTAQADYIGRRLVVPPEMPKGKTLRMDLIKSITGKDPMSARHVHKDSVQFMPTCKIIMFGNDKPKLPGRPKLADLDRLKLVPFKFEAKADKQLEAKLQAEGPGILRALIDACLDWQKHGLVIAKAVERETATYFAELDVYSRWFDVNCVVEQSAFTATRAAYENWKTWAEARSEKAGSEMDFSDWLESRGYVKDRPRRGGEKVRGFRGFKLKA